jgi:hypothetical protein
MSKLEKENDEVTLKEIILTAIKWWHFFYAKWKAIVGMAFIGAVFGIVVAFMTKPTYLAHLTLALEDQGEGASPYAGIASQFGLDIGGGGGAFSGENNIELLKSRSLIEKALLTPVVIDGNRDLLVNRYIQFNELDKKWQKNPLLAGISFKENEPRDGFSVEKDSLLSLIYKNISKKGLEVSKIDKNLSIISVDFKSKDQLFAKLFTESLVETSSRFYIETKTKHARQNLNALENRLDSVKKELDKEIYGAAQSKDQSMNTIRAKGTIQSAKKQLNVQVLTAMYGELVKNTELAKFTLMREEPLIQIIDTPILPLEQKKIGKLIGLIVGGFLGAILAMLYFWIKEMKEVILTSSN